MSITHEDVRLLRRADERLAHGSGVLLPVQMIHAGFHRLAIERAPMRGRPWPDKALGRLHRVGDVDQPAGLSVSVTASKWSSPIGVPSRSIR